MTTGVLYNMKKRENVIKGYHIGADGSVNFEKEYIWHVPKKMRRRHIVQGSVVLAKTKYGLKDVLVKEIDYLENTNDLCQIVDVKGKMFLMDEASLEQKGEYIYIESADPFGNKISKKIGVNPKIDYCDILDKIIERIKNFDDKPSREKYKSYKWKLRMGTNVMLYASVNTEVDTVEKIKNFFKSVNDK